MSQAHLSDLELDAALLGAGGEAGARHLEGCAACRARRDALAADAARFRAEEDLAALADRTVGRSRRAAPLTWARRAAPALAAAAVAVLLVLTPEGTRLKGAGRLAELFVVGADGEPRPLVAPVEARAELALRLSPARPLYARVLWEAAPDRRSALYPQEQAPAWRVEQMQWLPHKIVLDGAPEPERLLVVSCSAPFDHPTALAEAAHPARCALQAIEVSKR